MRGCGLRVSYSGGSRMVGSRKGFAQQETDILNRMCKHSIWRSKCACRGTRTRMPRKGAGKGYMENRTRNIHVGTRLNEAEHKKLMDLCDSTGLGTTRLLRKLIVDQELPTGPSRDLRAVLRAIDRVGNNMNQLAHRANIIGLVDKAEWDRAKALQRELREEVAKWR